MEFLNTNTSCCVGSHKSECLAALNEEEYNVLLSNSVLIKFDKHEIIYKQGGFVSNIMLVESGLVKVYIENEFNSLVLKIVTEGHLLGLTSVSEKINTHQYSAMTYIDSMIRQIDLKYFRMLITKNPNFAKAVIDILNANSIQINNRFFCITHKQAYGRVADIIICLSERVFKSDVFDLPLNRKQLAELTGLTPETVIRLLKQFSDEGLIKVNGKSIEVVDFNLLKKISQKG